MHYIYFSIDITCQQTTERTDDQDKTNYMRKCHNTFSAILNVFTNKRTTDNKSFYAVLQTCETTCIHSQGLIATVCRAGKRPCTWLRTTRDDSHEPRQSRIKAASYRQRGTGGPTQSCEPAASVQGGGVCQTNAEQLRFFSLPSENLKRRWPSPK